MPSPFAENKTHTALHASYKTGTLSLMQLTLQLLVCCPLPPPTRTPAPRAHPHPSTCCRNPCQVLGECGIIEICSDSPQTSPTGSIASLAAITLAPPASHLHLSGPANKAASRGAPLVIALQCSELSNAGALGVRKALVGQCFGLCLLCLRRWRGSCTAEQIVGGSPCKSPPGLVIWAAVMASGRSAT